MQSNTPRTRLIIFSWRGYIINHDLFVQLFCQHQLYLLFASLRLRCAVPPKQCVELRLLAEEMDLLTFGPILPKIPYETVSNNLVGKKKANFAHKIDPLSMENRHV